jgi:predicted ATPase with chaperone activity
MHLIKIVVASVQPESIQRYQNRISGPLLDRIDLHIDVPPCKLKNYKTKNPQKTLKLFVNA